MVTRLQSDYIHEHVQAHSCQQAILTIRINSDKFQGLWIQACDINWMKFPNVAFII